MIRIHYQGYDVACDSVTEAADFFCAVVGRAPAGKVLPRPSSEVDGAPATEARATPKAYTKPQDLTKEQRAEILTLDHETAMSRFGVSRITVTRMKKEAAAAASSGGASGPTAD